MTDLGLQPIRYIMKWEYQPIIGQIPLIRAGHTCIAINNINNSNITNNNSSSLLSNSAQIVLVGGYGDSIEYDDYVSVDINSYTMSVFAPIDKNSESASRVGHATVLIGNLVYSYGGWNGKRYINFGILYDPDNSTILFEKSKGRPMPEGRRDHSMVYSNINKKVYLFGGWNCSDQLNDLWCLDDGWDWSIVTVSGNIPSGRRGHTACIFQNNMIIFGGLYGLSKYLNELYLFDIVTSSWSLQTCLGDIPSPRAWHTSTIIGKFMVVFGGTAGRTSFYDDVYVLNLENFVWSKSVVSGVETLSSNTGVIPSIDKNEDEEVGVIADSPSFRASHSAVAVDSKIYIFGGLSPIGKDYKITPQNDLWVLETNLNESKE